jgi:hypothetical protein
VKYIFKFNSYTSPSRSVSKEKYFPGSGLEPWILVFR